jgi:hypothetical protein
MEWNTAQAVLIGNTFIMCLFNLILTLWFRSEVSQDLRDCKDSFQKRILELEKERLKIK